MAKNLRVRTASGWTTKPAPDLPENRLTAEEVDDNFLALEREFGGPVFDLVAYATVSGSYYAGWQTAMSALVTYGNGIIQLPPGVSDIGGALQDTGGANAQLLLPSIYTSTGKQITVVIRGYCPPPTAFAVVSSTPLPDQHSVLRSTLTAGSGGALLGCHNNLSSGNFSLVHVRLENLTLRMPANPTHTAADLSKVTNLEIDNVVIDAGEYQAQAISVPTTSTSYGIKFPKNNNGADVRVGCLNIIGFYNGFQHSEHLNAKQINVWSCLRAVESTFGYHASHIKRLMVVHCARGIVATGGISYLEIDQLDIEHAVSGWWAPVYDIDDASNYLRGRLRHHVVKAGVGVDSTFTVNGADGMHYARVGTPFSPKGFTRTANYTATELDAGHITRMDVATANTFTISAGSSVPWPKDVELHLMQIGDGATSFVAGAGVTLNKPSSKTLTLAEKGAPATAKRRGNTDVWDVFGALGAA